MSDQPADSPTFSLMRVLVLAIPLAVAAYVGANWYQGDVQRDATDEMEKDIAKRMLGSYDAALQLADKYEDSDGDLLADPPADEQEWLDPDEIVFSYVATADSEADEEEGTWKDLMQALGEKLGKPVKYQRFADPDEQLRALAGGDLHVAAFGTGEAPTAVNTAGFIPVCVPGEEDGSFGYTMQIIVPAGSAVKQPADIKGKRMTFTRPNSNSGYKAALILLLDKHKLAPERDYSWGFSYGHENSIEGVAAEEYQAASVASDILERMIAADEVDGEAIATIYESERFPPGVIGYAYNLKPELREGITEVLTGFEFAGTGLEAEFGGSGDAQFVAIDYKKDWEAVREIDAAVAKAKAELGGAN